MFIIKYSKGFLINKHYPISFRRRGFEFNKGRKFYYSSINNKNVINYNEFNDDDDDDDNSSFYHTPVLLKQAVNELIGPDDGIYIDCTLGLGGHSSEILRQTKKAKVIGIDRDIHAIQNVLKDEEMKSYIQSGRFIPFHSNYSEMVSVLDQLNIKNEPIHGILMDLGVSSMQIDNPLRGFSYRIDKDGPLDMRMDQSQSFSAFNIVNEYSFNQLRDIIYKYGDEPSSGKIANAIISYRSKNKKISTTGELVNIINDIFCKIPPKAIKKKLKRTFQALRIVVNGELDGLKKALVASESILHQDGRLCIISFHSGEDYITKSFIKITTNPKNNLKIKRGRFNIKEFNNISNTQFYPSFYLLKSKSLTPDEDEIKENKRSKSAIMRIAGRTSSPPLFQQLNQHGITIDHVI